MEFLPFFFCESVCVLLKNVGNLAMLCHKNPNCDYWSAAIGEETKKRPAFKLEVSCASGEWAHIISDPFHKPNKFKFSRAETISFAVLQTICAKRHLRLEEISIFNADFCTGTRASVAEIEEILEFTAPYVYEAEFCALSYQESAQFSHETLEKLLSICNKQAFTKIHLDSQHDLFEAFVKPHLRFGFLEKLIVAGKCSDDFCSAIEEFALQQPYRLLQFDAFKRLDFEFFKQFYRKPLVGVDRCVFRAKKMVLYFLEELREFEKENQMTFDSIRSSWRRTDGLVFGFNYNKSLQFELILSTDA